MSSKIFNRIFEYIPQITFQDINPEKMYKIADYISRPAPNRAIMGATALITQPLIDARNKQIDPETRSVSWKRTLSKIVVGTFVGLFVRQFSYDLVKAMTSPEKNKQYSKWLIPKSKLTGLKESSVFLKNYRTALSTLSALGIMIYTNFQIDAPLTAICTNKLIGIMPPKAASQSSNKDKKEGFYARA